MTDVAKAAGVSHQTVSRVVNGMDRVRPETRQRVLDAMTKMGYRRNEAARSLASNSSRLIGIVTRRFTSFGPASALLSLQLAANKDGYLVSVAAIEKYTKQNLNHAISELLSMGVAGIIVMSPLEVMAQQLVDQAPPVPTLAVASKWLENSSMSWVGVNQRSGVRAGLEYLKDVGAQTVAHLSGTPGWFDAAERSAAWRQSTEELGLTLGPELVGDWTAARGASAAIELGEGPLPDAIFVANDQMALGMLHSFAAQGIVVPRDIRLFGFDDEVGSAYYQPSLATVRQNFPRLGTVAVDMLTRMVHNQEVTSQLVDSELVVRASIGASEGE